MELGAREAERAVLLRLDARVDQQVAARDAGVHRPRTHVHRDVSRAQEEELDVVLGVTQHELAGIAALAVASLTQELDGRLRQGSLIGNGNAKHGDLQVVGRSKGEVRRILTDACRHPRA